MLVVMVCDCRPEKGMEQAFTACRALLLSKCIRVQAPSHGKCNEFIFAYPFLRFGRAPGHRAGAALGTHVPIAHYYTHIMVW